MADRLPHGLRLEFVQPFVLAIGFLLLLESASWAQDVQPDLANVDIEQLMNMEVTSVSGRAKRVSHTASAIYVITAEDIRRSGATSIPDLLRFVPGMQVMQINSHVWAISTRGFAQRYANKLLVLVDGRSIYTTKYGGVDWDSNNVMLEDIERIEVIRGPGAALWGTNAVNGVINITTRRSQDTQGGLLTTSIGTQERVRSNLRYGGAFGPNATYRVFGQFFSRDGTAQAAGSPGESRWQVLSGGFRTDWNPTPSDAVTFMGNAEDRDANDLTAGFVIGPPFQQEGWEATDLRGGEVLARWQHFFPRGDDISVQFSYDRMHLFEDNSPDHRGRTILEFQHHRLVGNRQDWFWGVGFRRDTSKSDGDPSFFWERRDVLRDHSNYNVFAQNEITAVPERLYVILGAKLEHEKFSGLHFLLNFRVLWTPGSRHSVWAAVARTVRTPTEVEQGARIILNSFPGANGVPTALTLSGGEESTEERVTTFELGYRSALHSRFSVDIASFYSDYNDLATIERGVPYLAAMPAPAHLVIPLDSRNKMDGETYGVEVAADWNVSSRWMLRASYARLVIRLHPHPDSVDTETERNEGFNPGHQFVLRSRLQLPRNFEFDSSLYHDSSLPQFPISANTRVDAQVTWRPTDATSISAGGRNLLEPRHEEFGRLRDDAFPGLLERDFFVKWTWRF
jgi:iron complex outermembrane receptor protein